MLKTVCGQGGALAPLMMVVLLILAGPAMAQGAAVSLAPPPGTETPATPRVEIQIGRTEPVPLDRPISDVIIANPEVADVIVRDPSTVFILGRKQGSTNLFLLGANGRVVHSLEILVTPDLTGAAAALRKFLPDARIDLEGVGSGVLISGWVRTAKEAADAVGILKAYLGIRTPEPTAADPTAAATPQAGSTEGGAGSGAGTMPGMPALPQPAAGGSASSSGAASSGASDGPPIINALRIVGDQQVLLQVRVAEMQRNTLKALNANLASDLMQSPNLQFPGFDARISATQTLDTWIFRDLALDVLERQGLVKVLAEPTLTAISGETANFLAGGEFPVPSGVDRNGNVRIEFRPFGVSLSFTPVVLANNQLSLRIATEVSRIAEENSISLAFSGGLITIKGLTVRRAASTVMLPSGGSLMIAGILQNEELNRVDGLPFVKDLPVLGALFRSDDFRFNRTELVVAVKAVLARPMEFGERLALPTDGFLPASDYDIYVAGRLFKRYGGETATPRAPVIAGPVGYIME